MFKIFLLLVTGSLFTLTLPAQTKTALTHETMWMMKRVGAPEVSPNGSMVIFSLQEPSYNEKDIATDLWVVPADGSAKPRRLTFSKSAEAGYKWSPDSRSIAFSAKREEDEVAQVYIMNVKDGGEAQRLTSISTGAAGPMEPPWQNDPFYQ